MKKKILLITLIISMICVNSALTNVPITFGNPTTVLAVDPPIVDGTSEGLTIGSPFSINITIHEVTDMIGYEIWLSYNPGVLTATSAEFYPPFIELWESWVDDWIGLVRIVSVDPSWEGFDNLPDDPPFPVARIDFVVDDYGFSPLHLQDTIIYDINWLPIDHITTDGNFSLVSSAPPIAQFTYSPSNPSVSELVTFNASTSNDPDGNIVSYDWSFGDGAIGAGMITNHAYDTAGTYLVYLNVTDNQGYWNTTTKSITIYGQHTDVSGRISTNTTWSLANSPYNVVGDVIVETNIFLTIEPGVIVKFNNGTNLIIDGALIAQGDNAHQISFTGNSAVPQRGDWGTIRFRATSIDEACIIAWAMIEYGNSGITLYDSGPRIENSTIRFNIRGIYSESNGIARIFDSEFLNNTYGITGNFNYEYGSSLRSTVSSSRIFGNTYGVDVSGGNLIVQQSSISHNTYGIASNTYYTMEIWETTVSGNTYGIWTWSSYSGSFRIIGSNISDNFYGITANSATISKSIISNNNGTGISPYFNKYGNATYYSEGAFTITYSTIAGNKENGVISKSYSTNTIRFSNIYGNTPYDLVNLAQYERNADVNATDNWWGTTNSTGIDQHIYDYYDDFNLRKVGYKPFLNSSVIIPPIAHDVAIVSITASPTTVEKWQSVYINVYVINHGDFSENVTVIARYDSVEIGTWRYYSGLMLPGVSSTASFYWYVGSMPGGNYTISAEVIVVPGEIDTADNFFVDGVVTVIGPPPSHDVAITSIMVYNATTVSPGEIVTITVTVQNQGNFNESFNVTAYYDDTIIESKTVNALSSVSYLTLTFLWNTTGVAGGQYQIKAEASIVPGEVDTSDNFYADGWITVAGPRPPYAYFYYYPSRPSVGYTVEFYASSSYDPDGYIVSYAWDFGDGATANTTSSYMTHVYSNAGNYTVQLTVTDNSGQTDSAVRALRVNAPPVASFTWTPEEIRANETVTFKSLSYDPDGWITYYSWYFGDGASGYGIEVSHVYTQIGTFWVTLAVTDNDGASATSQVSITVLPKLTITTTPNEGIVGTLITLAGANATPYSEVSIHWGTYILENYSWRLVYTMIGQATANSNGEFSFSFTVPSSIVGLHFIRAIDVATRNCAEKTFNVLPYMTADLTSGPVGSKVTLKGTGFPYEMGPGFSYLMFDDQLLGFATADENGEMQASINIPFASLGPHVIKVLITTSYPYPGSPQRYTVEAAFTIIDTTDLDVTADVGAIYFKGETAEFYAKTALKGERINATSISVKLRLYDGTTQSLSPQLIETGVYRMSFTINGKGSMTGTYNIIIDASYKTETVVSHGTAVNAFVVKPTWEKQAPRIAALSLASIGLISAMILVWRKEKKRYL